MMFDSFTVTNEMERRYEFVSKGAQNARWLQRLAKDRLCVCGNRLLQSAGKALSALGTWLQQKRPLHSPHA